MAQPLIIVWPQASGKTKNAASFLQVFGCSRLVDDPDGVAKLEGGDLALTNMERFGGALGYQQMSVLEALKRIGVAR